MIPNEHRVISRRGALRGIAAGTGAAATALWLDRLTLLAQDPAMHTHLAAAASAQAAAAPFTPKALSAAQLESVATLAELIIPTTDTPGARAALVDRFVDNILANTQPADKERFLTGLAWMDTRSTALYSKPFAAATPPVGAFPGLAVGKEARPQEARPDEGRPEETRTSPAQPPPSRLR